MTKIRKSKQYLIQERFVHLILQFNFFLKFGA